MFPRTVSSLLKWCENVKKYLRRLVWPRWPKPIKLPKEQKQDNLCHSVALDPPRFVTLAPKRGAMRSNGRPHGSRATPIWIAVPPPHPSTKAHRILTE
eukprot:4998028-Prymnesium_polylepis.1